MSNFFKFFKGFSNSSVNNLKSGSRVFTSTFLNGSKSSQWIRSFNSNKSRYYTAQAQSSRDPIEGIKQARITNFDQQGDSFKVVELTLNDGAKAQFDPIWLRDNCTCSKCWDPSTLQRSFHHIEIPSDIEPSNLQHDQDGLAIIWNNDGHKSFYPYHWLQYHHQGLSQFNPKFELDKQLWDRKLLGNDLTNLTKHSYDKVLKTDNWLKDLVNTIQKFGIGLVENTPVTSEATEILCNRLGPIRHTHFGGFWEFEANQLHNDAAYQSGHLEPHTDTTYFSDPAGLQIFHALDVDGVGGDQIYLDGFTMATKFQQDHPELYKVLAYQKHPYHSAGDEGQYQHATHPIFTHMDPNDVTSPLKSIQYNYDSRSTPPHSQNPSFTRKYYHALNTLIKNYHQSLELRIQYTLKKGTVVILDNTRVMHGRTEFQAKKRKLCGAYISKDDIQSNWRSVNGWDKRLTI